MLTAPGDSAVGTPVAAAPASRHASASRARLLARWIGPVVAVVLFALALHALRGELALHSYSDIVREVRTMPLQRLLAAAAFTALTYAILPAYDALALAYAGRRLSLGRMGLGSFVAYGLSQTLGFPSITGSAVRYRFWSAWGMTTTEIAQAAAFAGLTFTLGVLFVSGAALVLEPAATLRLFRIPPAVAVALGTALLAIIAAFTGWSALHGGRELRVRGWAFPVPALRFTLAQLVVAVADWAAAAAVLYVLLPSPAPIGFLPFAGAFVLAHAAGLISHVPGGIGVFETLMILVLRPVLPADQALGILLAYRAIFYLVPFGLALLALAAHEAGQHRERIAAVADSATSSVRAVGASAVDTVARWAPGILPPVLSVATFAAGVLLLLSGATPGVRARETSIVSAVSLPVVELSHLAGSLAGAGLLVLAWAIRRRLDAAYPLTVAALGVGIVASLLKGIDYEEATLLAIVLAAVLPFRHLFYRRTALTAEPFTPGWTIAVVAVLGTVAWVGVLSYEHVEYGSELWWRFRPHGDASRFLRAGMLSSGGLLAFGLLRLLRHADVEPAAPGADQLARASTVIGATTNSAASLALLGDKALLFSESGRAFIQYGIKGRSWVAMGDPVIGADCPPEEATELAWTFRRLVDEQGGWPVFYQGSPAILPLYIDLGLTLFKLGEEARVPLTGFSMEGSGRRGLRRALKDVEKTGARFEVIPAAQVPALLPELRAVSDHWLADKHVHEKRFSLGFFDEAYLARFPVAVLRMPVLTADAATAATADAPTPTRIVAFANVWPGDGSHELSVDLMRFADAPRGAMDYIFLHLMLWGRDAGYEWFNLGMAPLAGIEPREVAPLWARASAWLFQHGEHFYNFQGLRHYKEKFDPVWTPKYLAAPGGLALPRVLVNVATLVSGGVTGVLRR